MVVGWMDGCVGGAKERGQVDGYMYGYIEKVSFPGGSVVKNLPTMQETRILLLRSTGSRVLGFQ